MKFQKKLQSVVEYMHSGSFLQKLFSDYWTVTRIRDVDCKGYLNRGVGCISIDQAKNAPLEQCDQHGELLINYLASLFSLMSTYDVQLIIYDFPWPKNFNSKHKLIKHLENMKALIKVEAEPHSNVHLIDEYFFWDEKYFVDPLHLNHRGAVKLTEYLADYIAPQNEGNLLKRQ